MIPFPNKKYKVILADPPWMYEATRENGKKRIFSSASIHYDLMEDDDIMTLPVSTITEDNCLCFMWATWPKLETALALMKAWGFAFKTRAFTWVKLNKGGVGYFMGNGFYTRGNDEFVLLGVKGNAPNALIVDHGVSSLVVTHVSDHSAKPDEVRRRIVKLCGDVSRIELFARHKAHGWNAWGNEVEDLPTLEQFSPSV